MKLNTMFSLIKGLLVAPRAGAWIETREPSEMPSEMPVAPRAGAWIETSEPQRIVDWKRSPPARGRGLKHLTAYGLQPKKLVSPRVEGA